MVLALGGVCDKLLNNTTSIIRVLTRSLRRCKGLVSGEENGLGWMAWQAAVIARRREPLPKSPNVIDSSFSA